MLGRRSTLAIHSIPDQTQSLASFSQLATVVQLVKVSHLLSYKARSVFAATSLLRLHLPLPELNAIHLVPDTQLKIVAAQTKDSSRTINWHRQAALEERVLSLQLHLPLHPLPLHLHQHHLCFCLPVQLPL